MKVLVTGSFGNVGESTILALLEKGCEIRCFDLSTPKNNRIEQTLRRFGDFETIWGDIRSEEQTREATEAIDCIIHLAAIIPPASDRNPELTKEVNVGGTKNLINAANSQSHIPKFIYASSIATYGHCTGQGPPRTAEDPQVATDLYTETKIKSELLVRQSGLEWTILRFGVIPSLQESWLKAEMDSTMFEIPLEQRIEFIHTRDVGVAAANAVEARTNQKILLIGGGEACRMTYRDFLETTLESMGIGMFPSSAFKSPQCDEDYFHTDWMDTTEANDLLHFQKRTLSDYAEELKKGLGYRKYLIRLFKPIARRKMLAMSPYYNGI